MLAERSKKLQEHHEKLGAIIAQLQIEKAKQVNLALFISSTSIKIADLLWIPLLLTNLGRAGHWRPPCSPDPPCEIHPRRPRGR